MAPIKMHAVVVLLEDVPAKKLVRGEVGTIVEELTPAVCLVEFSDDDGRTYAMEPLPYEKLVEVRHNPLQRVAAAA